MTRTVRSSVPPWRCDTRVARVAAPGRFLAAILVLCGSVRGAEPPAAAELLRKFAEGQDKAKSFVLLSELSTELKETGRAEPYKTHGAFEARSDGERWSVRWLEVDHAKTDHVFCWWDGALLRQLNRLDKGGNVLMISAANRPKERFFTWFGAGIAAGYVPCDMERVDAILSKARTISVRAEPEMVGSSECRVIDADTERGRYTLWIAPQLDHNLAKATIERRGGDKIFAADVLPKGHVMKDSLDSVSFEKHGDAWLAVEAHSSSYQCTPGNREVWGKTHYRVTEMKINPDHRAMGSFRCSNELLDGARVMFAGISNYVGVWRDGRVVDDKGKALDVPAMLKKQP